jgi:hypothetical protein
VFVLLLLLLLLADGLYVVVQSSDDLQIAADALQNGTEALKEGDLERADDEFSTANERANGAVSLMNHPSAVIASYIPFLSDDAGAARALPRVAELTSEAGLTAVDAGSQLGGTSSKALARAFYRDGRIQLETLEQAEPFVTQANGLIEEALDELQGAPTPSLGLLLQAYSDTTVRLNEAAQLSRTGSVLLRTVPPLLGSGGAKRYLLVFESPSEARATGGLIGLYGLLEADDGVVNLTHVGPFSQLTDTLEDQDRSILDPNRRPEFPTVARRLLTLYEEAADIQIDGVLATDPVALQQLTKATGPLEVQGSPPLGPDNTAETLLHDSYIEFERDPARQTRLLAQVVLQFYRAIGSGDVDGATLIQEFAGATDGRHVKVFANDEGLQASLTELGAAGSLTGYGPNVQLVFQNNLAKNKVDYFLRRSIDTVVEFDENGNAQVETTITLNNNAPAEASAVTRSFSRVVPPGVNRMELGVVAPRGALLENWTVEGTEEDVTVDEEVAFPFTVRRVTIPPGERTEISVSYRLRSATDLLTGGDFEFTLLPHPTVTPDRYSLTFEPPPGFIVSSERQGGRVGSGSLRFRGELGDVQRFRIGIEAL